MRICHIALQGCLQLTNVPYGITADTGGHIKFLLELVNASARDPNVETIDIVTRGFVDAKLGNQFAPDVGEIRNKIRLIRLADGTSGYLPKEDLWREHDRLCEAFGLFIESKTQRPDLIHAHYADAGILAAYAKRRFGIPFVFTGHSLGAVKLEANGGDADEALTRRIDIEERVLAEANAVIASSRDEAEAQYLHYNSVEAGRIRVIPPGCDVGQFEGSQVNETVREEVTRFLRDPDKPIILAIARPVRKKNLIALLEAFGGDAELKDLANLVIVAGNRENLTDLEDECAEVMRELIEGVDLLDLYGSVAYPKDHSPADIPAYYALARESGGVFVNPALNEPFGLTLLEAAAARVPVVATDSGGPNDIIERCENGLLVCPTDRSAIADACKSIIGDRRKWIRYAAAGAQAVKAYDWNAHRDIYHRLARDLTAPVPQAKTLSKLLVCDIDNTLLGDRQALEEFLSWQERLDCDTAVGIATGRSFHSAQAILAAEGVPSPTVIISSVGTQIHWLDPRRQCFTEDYAWSEHIGEGWDRDEVARIGVAAGLKMQSLLEQKPGKVSFFLGSLTLQRIQAAFAQSSAPVEVVVSHDRYVDILPARFGKGPAVRHAAKTLGVEARKIVVAGDSGNDLSMLKDAPLPIVVGNWSDGLGENPELRHAYVAKATHAAGVMEGVRYYQSKKSW
ncbi:HAD-IIB family hydrolase [Allopontixanthobacter sediminis]|uniref:sucrose-phosphate synthase n=1 Tax=Allopontixanthobacter sediminis TaxID=1689985 RepID=A0A845AZQ1_9SPHN|nr:HAD-IIB family hydrolase [Allopontixanthobacter sediminis]